MNQEHSKLHYIGVFLFFLIIFLLAQTHKKIFFDFDSYYNIKHSTIIAENHLKPTVEAWANYHFLTFAPTDGYFLYHELMAVLIKIFDPLLGSIIFSAINISFLLTVLYFLISKITSNKKAFIYTTIILLSSTVFSTRLLQLRAFIPSVAILLLVYYFLNKKRYFLASTLTAISILMYNLSFIIIYWALIEIVFNYCTKKTFNLKPLIACLSGLLLGLILHPFTLNYLTLIFSHLIQVPYLKIIGLYENGGGEVKNQGIGFFIAHNYLAITIYMACSWFWIKTILKQKNLFGEEKTKLLIISFPWFIVSIFFVRGTEYWIPFGGLFCAHILAQNEKIFIDKINLFFKKYDTKIGILKKILTIIFYLSLFSTTTYFLIYISSTKDSTKLMQDYSDVNQYLKDNSPAKSLVCFPSWDTFSIMFYFNDHNTYPFAFDPVFTYNYDKKFFTNVTKVFGIDRICKKTKCSENFVEEYLYKIEDILYNQINCKYFVIDKQRYPILNFYIERHQEIFTPLKDTQKLKLYSIKPKQK